MEALKKFLQQHPAIISATEALAAAGIEGAEDVLVAVAGAHLGFISKLLPLQSILDNLAGRAVTAVDSALDKLGAAPTIAIAPPNPAPNPKPTVNSSGFAGFPNGQTDPLMQKKQALAKTRLEEANSAAAAAQQEVDDLKGL